MNLQHKITDLKGKKLSLSPHGHKQADMEERLCEDIQAGWKKKKKILVSLQMFSPPRWLLTMYLLIDWNRIFLF